MVGAAELAFLGRLADSESSIPRFHRCGPASVLGLIEAQFLPNLLPPPYTPAGPFLFTPRHKHTCRECAEICEECAKHCEREGDMQECMDASANGSRCGVIREPRRKVEVPAPRSFEAHGGFDDRERVEGPCKCQAAEAPEPGSWSR